MFQFGKTFEEWFLEFRVKRGGIVLLINMSY